VGAGEAINSANQYTEIPVASASVPMLPGFGDKTTHSFAYLAGVGIEMDVTNHIRLGGVYRYVNLGRAQLSTTSIQESSDVLKNNPLHVNEIMLQLSYLG
jgi:opacity protein-like surface antigen